MSLDRTREDLMALGVLMARLNADGSYGLYTVSGLAIQSVAPVYALPGITISGVTTLPAANTFYTGSVVRLHPDNFVGTGVNPTGVFVVADALNNIWRPHGVQILWGNTGTLASPLATLAAAAKFNIGTDPIIPGGLLRADSKLIFKAKYRKVGATAPVVRIDLGTDMTTPANNSIVYGQTVSGTANRDIFVWAEVDFETTTTAFTSNRSQIGAGGADGQFADISTLLDTTANMKVMYEASTLAADTVNLISYSVEWAY